MLEILLRSNARIATLLAAGAVVVLALGIVMVAFFQPSILARLGGWTLVAGGAVCWCATVWMARRPRLAYRDGQVLVFLHAGRPFQVPIDVVEVFFLGQGPVADDDCGSAARAKMVAANVVIRLAEAATEWHQRDVNKTLGLWEEGYITIRGLWCEPVDGEVVKRMNRWLVATKRKQRTSVQETSS